MRSVIVGAAKRSLACGCFVAIALIVLCAAGSIPALRAAERSGPILVTEIKGAIGVAATRLITDAFAKARQENARALFIQLDTPGGLVTSTRDIIQQILASPVPVIVYVSSGGARAASAGTFLVYAAHIAAMAPGTNVGAATPIEIGGVSLTAAFGVKAQWHAFSFDCRLKRSGNSSLGAEILLRLAGVKPNSDAIRIMISAWRLVGLRSAGVKAYLC